MTLFSFLSGGDGAGRPPLSMRVREYAHVVDETTGITELVVGPINRTLKPQETISVPPTPFHVVPHMHYAVVANPVQREGDGDTGKPVRGGDGQVKCRVGEQELRYSAVASQVLPPFPLYPDEKLVETRAMDVLTKEQYLVISVLAPHETKTSHDAVRTVLRRTGDKFIFRGPGAYLPRLDEQIAGRGNISLLPHDGTAFHCRALETFTRERFEGEEETAASSPEKVCGGTEYLYTEPGNFIPSPYEELVGVVKPYELGRDEGVHVEAREGYHDPRPFAKGVLRRPGECFLVTCDDCPCFPLHPYDRIVRRVPRIVVSQDEFCAVVVPMADNSRDTQQRPPAAAANSSARAKGKSVGRYRDRRVVTNTSFFLKPHEVLEIEPRPAYVLAGDQAVLVTALRDFEDNVSVEGGAVRRVRNDRWLVHGPRRFFPTSEMRVVVDEATQREVRERVILTEGQGLYVRNERSGVVRLVAGPTSYMLDADEQMWEKQVPTHVAQRLDAQFAGHPPSSGGAPLAGSGSSGDAAHPTRNTSGRTAHGVVYDVPNRSVTQLFNYRTQRTRTVFGPDRILLEPDEGFTVVSLSGSPWDPSQPNVCLPKEQNFITALHLYLGPSNMTDVMQVETSDHARLSLQLCYDWYFDIPHNDAEAANKGFKVNDFVGNTCSFIAGRVRSVVASLPFEQFHKRSAQVLREAVFGLDPGTGTPFTELRFPENNLVVTTVDIQEMQVLDARTLRGLRKSVEMAIEIATHTQEVRAQQVASAREQAARGLLERKQMNDQVEIEEQRGELLRIEQQVHSIVSSSKSTAMAGAMSEAATVESSAAVTAATVRTQREVLVNATLVDVQRARRTALKEHEANMSKEAADYQEKLETVRHDLMEQVVAALGPETMAEMAKAGPELQAKLLQSMGLEGYLVTDGSTPINLFDTAKGLTGDGAATAAAAGGATLHM